MFDFVLLFFCSFGVCGLGYIYGAGARNRCFGSGFRNRQARILGHSVWSVE